MISVSFRSQKPPEVKNPRKEKSSQKPSEFNKNHQKFFQPPSRENKIKNNCFRAFRGALGTLLLSFRFISLYFRAIWTFKIYENEGMLLQTTRTNYETMWMFSKFWVWEFVLKELELILKLWELVGKPPELFLKLWELVGKPPNCFCR